MQNKKTILCIGLLLNCCALWAQYKVHFVITKLPAYHATKEKTYLAGSFNNWNPGDENFLLKAVEGKPDITIELPRGTVEYKITKGNWETVECGNQGFPTENRKLFVDRDTTINIEIEHWVDHFPKKNKTTYGHCQCSHYRYSFFYPAIKSPSPHLDLSATLL